MVHVYGLHGSTFAPEQCDSALYQAILMDRS